MELQNERHQLRLRHAIQARALEDHQDGGKRGLLTFTTYTWPSLLLWLDTGGSGSGARLSLGMASLEPC